LYRHNSKLLRNDPANIQLTTNDDIAIDAYEEEVYECLSSSHITASDVGLSSSHCVASNVGLGSSHSVASNVGLSSSPSVASIVGLGSSHSVASNVGLGSSHSVASNVGLGSSPSITSNVGFDSSHSVASNVGLSSSHSVTSNDSLGLAVLEPSAGHSDVLSSQQQIVTVPSSGSSLISYAELKQAVLTSTSWIECNFNYCSKNTLITFVKLTDELQPRIEISVVVDTNYEVHVSVFGKELQRDHNIWGNIPNLCVNVSSIQFVLALLSSLNCCSAICDTVLTGFLNRLNDAVTLMDESNVPVSVRSKKCELIMRDGVRCNACSCFRKRLLMRHLRQKHCVSSVDITKSKQTNNSLSSPLRLSKLQLLARRSKGLHKKVSALSTKLIECRKRCADIIRCNGEKLNETDSDIIMQLAQDCKHSAFAEFPEGSFQQTFFQQQLKYNCLKNKASMRWHPTVIRWCLYIKSKSTKAYEGLRAFLSLPSSRTLYDYTHYMEHGTGINPKTVEQLIVKASNLGCYDADADHKSHIGILQDEVKIKSDLVYHKTTGELIGYVFLDNVANELLNLEHLGGHDRQLAEYMLVTMVRGITTNLCYPLSAYATKSVSASALYTIVWECVECLETVVGLKVLYICCDGAVQNRKFFLLHSQSESTQDDDVLYKTKNLYATDGRDIYFVSDPPHLLKTARNCLASSYDKSKTRHMWYNGDISWDHVVRLYKEQCSCESEFRLCPKLTTKHINLTSFSKMRVSLAAQVLSATVANALDLIYEERAKCTAEFIHIMNKWFDVMNVKNLYEGKRCRNTDLNPFTSINDERLKWLETDFIQYLNNWKDAVANRPGQFTAKQRKQMLLSDQTLYGLKLTCKSTVAIVRQLLTAGAPFVLTSHINQDPLEQFFGHCRHKAGSNDNPTVAEACHIINTIRTISTQAVANVRGNTTAHGNVLDNTPVPRRSAVSKK